MIRVRLCPSPTGSLHIGTARTALFNILFARHHNATVVFRIEDTDKERSTLESEKDIIDGFKWLGFTWDEGMEVGGPQAPYRQSERTEVYQTYIKKLIDTNAVYPCFCSEEELNRAREQATQEKRAVIYPGTCSQLTTEDIKQKELEGVPFTLRLRVPEKRIIFQDLVRGDVEFDTSLIGDIIIAKDMQTPLYHLAVVIDDFEMGITHVIRGEDHLSNTPKQILLIEALGFPVPLYGHIPLILNADRSKMSKRKNKVSLIEYKNEGYLPEAIVNFMALLGWNPGTEQELFSLEQLITDFDISRVQKSGAIFNLEKLQWMNSQYIKAMPRDILVSKTVPFLVTQGYIKGDSDASEFTITRTGEILSRDTLGSYIAMEQERVKTLGEIPSAIAFCFERDLVYEPSLLLWKDASKETTRDMLLMGYDIINEIPQESYTVSYLETVLKEEITKRELKNGTVLWPLRTALSGQQSSPGPFEIACALGKEQTLSRIKKAIDLLTE